MIFVALFLAVGVLGGLYLFFLAKRILSFFGVEKKSVLYSCSAVAAVLLLVSAFTDVFGVGMSSVLMLILCGAVTDFVYLVAERAVKHFKKDFKRLKLYASGLLTLVVTACVLFYGFWNINHVTATRYELRSEKEVELRVAMIADLHLGNSIDSTELKEYCGKIQAENPDVFVLVGDLFDEGTSLAEMVKAAEVLGGVETKYGTYFVYGNHDRGHYRNGRGFGGEEIEAEFEKNGITVLEDECVEIGNEFCVVGRNDASMGHFGSERKELSTLLSEVNRERFVLLLDHQPKDLKTAAELGVDLQLSGHTHAGQIWPLGQFSELFGINEMNYGLKKDGDFNAVVTSGISGWGFSVRTAEKSEYVVIDINKNQ